MNETIWPLIALNVVMSGISIALALWTRAKIKQRQLKPLPIVKKAALNIG
jgi:hypothetical protein